MDTPPLQNVTLPLEDWEEILHVLRRRAWDLKDQASEFGFDSRYGAILYNESLTVSAIADELESILPEPEDAT